MLLQFHRGILQHNSSVVFGDLYTIELKKFTLDKQHRTCLYFCVTFII